MRLEGRPRWEGQLPSWLEIGTHVRVVGNSNEHNYAIGGEVVVVEMPPRMDGRQMVMLLAPSKKKIA